LLAAAAAAAAARFVFKDQFIELSTVLPADADLYGLGEATLRTGLRLPRNGTVLTMWNRDLASAGIEFNLYGSHPFYLQVNAGEVWGCTAFSQLQVIMDVLTGCA
jgi:hypothetical protein